MIKNKKARRTAKTLRQIKLRWLRLHYIFAPSTQRLLSIKHMHDITEQAKAEAMEKAKLDVAIHNKNTNRLVRQIKKCKLK